MFDQQIRHDPTQPSPTHGLTRSVPNFACSASVWKQIRWRSVFGQGPEECSTRPHRQLPDRLLQCPQHSLNKTETKQLQRFAVVEAFSF